MFWKAQQNNYSYISLKKDSSHNELSFFLLTLQMPMQFFPLLLTVILLSLSIDLRASADTISLDGEWRYFLLGAPTSIPAEGIINLPSTLDEAHKSEFKPESDNTNQFRREFSFSGEATYEKKIQVPESWLNKDIQLLMERTKPSSIKIDGKKIGSNSRISSPQRYNLSNSLTPGIHQIEIIVNNADSLPPIVSRSSHAASESTQTNWNGILGNFMLIAREKFHIESVTLDDNIKKNGFEATVIFSEHSPSTFTLVITIDDKNKFEFRIPKGINEYRCFIPLPENISQWSAFHPDIFDISFQLVNDSQTITDNFTLQTGLREFKTDNNRLTVNDYSVFLRGNVNAAVFPITAYAPMDEESWLEYFNTLKDYGFNHVRFHSWTPPEAAFSAADKTGIFIQTELPLWGEFDKEMNFTNNFMHEELLGIMEEYKNHPSFVMFSVGNELWGDINFMGNYIKEARELNPRILATHGSNVYLGMNGELEGDDFLVAAKTSDKISDSIRGSVSYADSSTGGHFNSTYPDSQSNFNLATDNINIPIIAHEVGQYQTYPNYEDINFYTGSLKPDNLKEFQNRAANAGTLNKAKKFSQSSGEWAAKLYKAEMEMSQRSEGLAGYQLFGLQDYPGQGTSLVGILNSLMQSKGFISTEDWKESCNDLMILAEFPKFTFYEGENIEIPIFIINYTENPDTIKNLFWQTDFQSGHIVPLPGLERIETGVIELNIPEINQPQKMQLKLTGNNGEFNNKYDFWIYPKHSNEIKNVTVTNNLEETLQILKKGGRVIFCPDSLLTKDATVKSLFTPDFWNYRMYRTICDEMNITPSPGTLGLLINEDHRALSKFPTDAHSDWQWFPIVKNSYPLIIDRLPKNFNPIIEVIDNVERNFRIALLLECNVGKGKLMILPANIDELVQYPEGKWFIQSLKEYMGSKECKPKITLSSEQVINLVTKPSFSRKIKELKNETYNSHW